MEESIETLFAIFPIIIINKKQKQTDFLQISILILTPTHHCVTGGCGHSVGGGEACKDQRCAERTTGTTLQVQVQSPAAHRVFSDIS